MTTANSKSMNSVAIVSSSASSISFTTTIVRTTSYHSSIYDAIHFYNKEVVTVIFSYHQRHHSNHCIVLLAMAFVYAICRLCVTKAIQLFIWIVGSSSLRVPYVVVLVQSCNQSGTGKNSTEKNIKFC